MLPAQWAAGRASHSTGQMGTQQRTSPRKRGEQRDHRLLPEAPLPMSQTAYKLKRLKGQGKGSNQRHEQLVVKNRQAKAKKKANAKRDLGGRFTLSSGGSAGKGSRGLLECPRCFPVLAGMNRDDP